MPDVQMNYGDMANMSKLFRQGSEQFQSTIGTVNNIIAILEGGGDIDFLIIGSTPMADPAMVFGNPRPSGRVLAKGDIINMELAAGYRGYTA